MPEELKEQPVPFYLKPEQKCATKGLYEKAFPEDSRRFVDFYYEYKTRDNEILVLEKEGQIVSMLHLNPYRMIVNGYETAGCYIVAVATREDCRHRGHLRTLLERYVCEERLASAMREVNTAVAGIYVLFVEPYLRIGGAGAEPPQNLPTAAAAGRMVFPPE